MKQRDSLGHSNYPPSLLLMSYQIRKGVSDFHRGRLLAPAALAPVFSVGAKQVLGTCFAPTEKWLTRRRRVYSKAVEATAIKH